jgi:hypothetical protein
MIFAFITFEPADRLVGTLRAHAQIREFEAGIGDDVVCVFDGRYRYSKQSKSMFDSFPTSGLDSEAAAHLARNEIASKLRTRQPLQLCLLVGGMVRCCNKSLTPSKSQIQIESSFSERVQKQVITGSQTYNMKRKGNELVQNKQSDSLPLSDDDRSEINPLLRPKLFWIDQYGSLQNLRYGSHGFGSNFALSILDQRYRSYLSREEAISLIQECFRQLRQRYVINSPNNPRIKCVDVYGVREILS